MRAWLKVEGTRTLSMMICLFRAIISWCCCSSRSACSFLRFRVVFALSRTSTNTPSCCRKRIFAIFKRGFCVHDGCVVFAYNTWVAPQACARMSFPRYMVKGAPPFLPYRTQCSPPAVGLPFAPRPCCTRTTRVMLRRCQTCGHRCQNHHRLKLCVDCE